MYVIDFETRSRADISAGVSRYARDSSTEVLCMAYGVTPSNIKIWRRGDPPPTDLFNAIEEGALLEAHNASFERSIWKYVCHARMGWPKVPEEAWRCTLAACSHLALPRALGDAAAVLGLKQQKDKAGADAMMSLCKPDANGRWVETPSLFDRLYDYCAQDVRTEMELGLTLGPLPDRELQLWQLDQTINMRGIPLDVNAVKNAAIIVKACEADADKRVQHLTSGKVKGVKQVSAMLAWINSKIPEDPMPDMTAESVSTWLGKDIPVLVRAILQLREANGLASVAKLHAMLERCDIDDRVRWNLVYHGAATGRWAGSGIQIQNFPRGVLSESDIELVHQLIKRQDADELDMMFGSPMECISSSLRSFIKATEGFRLIVGDFASIEARVLAWVAGEDGLLQTFADGGDVYKAMASKIYTVPEPEVSKVQRHVGKTAILGLGYGMGHQSFKGACQLMAGVTIDSKMAKKVVKTYRSANPKIKELWGLINNRCITAIENPGNPVVINDKLSAICDATYLRIKLPSGRSLHYRNPTLELIQAPWTRGYSGWIQAGEHQAEEIESFGAAWDEYEDGKFLIKQVLKQGARALANRFRLKLEPIEPEFIHQIRYMGVDSRTRKWGSITTYGGKLVENVIQAIARDFLAEAMLRIEAAGYPIIATVHDEIVTEVPNGRGSVAEFESIMKELPPWGIGCPIGVEGFESERYRK